MEPNNETNLDRWLEDRLISLTPPAAWQPDTLAGLARFRQGRDSKPANGKRYLWAAACATTIGVCAVAFPATRVFAQRCVSACVAETGIVRGFLSNRLSGSNPSAGLIAASQRGAAPDFVLADASGDLVRLSDFRGQVVLLNFWATWCGPCKTEIPWFTDFQRAYQNTGFAALGVSLDDDGWRSVKPYIQDKKIDYRIMVGNDEIARAFGGLDSLPTTLFIDKAGRIAVKHVGLVEKKTYEEEINTLIAEPF